MKKISNMELFNIIIALSVVVNSSVNRDILINNTGINSWITLSLGYIIGIIPILIILYISGYNKKMDLNKKIESLFNRYSIIIKIILFIIYFILCTTYLYSISIFITSQFIYRTPIYICSLLILIVVMYNSSKGINTITRVCSILSFIAFILFITNFFSLIENIKLDNIKPILVNSDGIFKTSLLVASNITSPFLIILNIPRDDIENDDKYNKTVIIGYIVSAIISILIVFCTLGVLGINLVKMYAYPEYIVLKKVKLFGFLDRVENIVANQWILWFFSYLSLSFNYLDNSIKKRWNNKYSSFIILSLIYVGVLVIYNNNMYFEYYLSRVYPYIIMSIIPIYLVMMILVYIKKKNNKIAS